MIDLKPYALFIQNTIKPIIDDVREILKELERQGAKLNEGNLNYLIKSAVRLHIWSCAYSCLAQVVAWVTVGILAWTILR